MKLALAAIAAALILPPHAHAWETTLGGSRKDALYQVLERPDGTYLGVGKTQSADGDLAAAAPGRGQDAWLVRLDAAGKKLGSRALGGGRLDVFTSVANTPDGGYVVVGSTRSADSDSAARKRKTSDTDAWVLKFSAAGALEWQRFLGGSFDDFGMAVLAWPDGSVYVGVDSSSPDGDVAVKAGARRHHGRKGGLRDFWLVKLDPRGRTLWGRSYGGTNHEYLSSVVATSDGNIALGGRTESVDGDVHEPLGEYDAWVIKVDPSGKLLWETTLGGEMWDWGSNIVATPDGGVLFSGYTFSWERDGEGNHGDYDYFLVRLDAHGKRLWHRAYGGEVDDFAQGLAALRDGTFLVTGGSVSKTGEVPENRGSFDVWALRIDGKGEPLWSRTFGGSAYDIAAPGGSDYYETSPGSALTPTRDGGAVMAGASRSRDGDVAGAHGGYDAWVVKWGPEELKGDKITDARGQKHPLAPEPVAREEAPEAAPAITVSRAFGGASSDRPLDSPQALAAKPDGGTLFVGSSYGTDLSGTRNHGASDAWVVSTDREGKLEWQALYGGSGKETGAAIALLADGGSVFVATAESRDGDLAAKATEANKGAVWVVRLDAKGKILWQRRLGASAHDVAQSVAATRDGAILVGATVAGGGGDVRDPINGLDFWIGKLDGRGRLLWARSAGGLSNDYLIQLTETRDGGVAAIGRTESETLDARGNHGMYDYLFVKLDGKGRKLFSRTYGAIDWEWGNSVVALREGGFALGGYTYTFDDFELGQVKRNHGEFDYWVARIDDRGELLWETSLGGANYELGYGLTETRDGGLAMVGGTASKDGQVSGNHGGYDAWVVKLDGSGKLRWQRALGGSRYDVGYAIAEAPDGGLWVLSETFSPDGDVPGVAGDEDAWLVKLK